MLKIFRRARKKLLEGRKIRGYLFYAIGEVFLVMIGILLAIQVSNLNNVKIQKKAERQFYQNFQRQISEDLQIINGTIDYNNNYKSQYQYAIQIIDENNRSKMDTLGVIAMNLIKYSDFDRASNIYESIVNSGEIKLIKNNKIIDKIQILEETYIYFNRMEDIHYDFVMSIVPELSMLINFSKKEVEQPNKIFDYQFQNAFVLAVNHMIEKEDVYNRAKNQIIEIIEMLELELSPIKN